MMLQEEFDRQEKARQEREKAERLRKQMDIMKGIIFASLTATVAVLVLIVGCIFMQSEPKQQEKAVITINVDGSGYTEVKAGEDDEVVVVVDSIGQQESEPVQVTEVMVIDTINDVPAEEFVPAVQHESQHAAYSYTEEELRLFEQIVAAESYSFWSYNDLLSLATVITNRIDSDGFPDTVNGVLTQERQFETYANGRYQTAEVTDTCRQAVADALAGKKNLNSDVKWFCTKEYYDGGDCGFFTTLNHVYTCRNVYFFEEVRQ